jgi:hypothetical protein
MLKYLNILLDDSSVSFCYYTSNKSPKPISKQILEKGVVFGMKENLNIQFVYPNNGISEDLEGIIQSVDHIKIGKTDVIVYDSWPEMFELDKICVLRVTLSELTSRSLPELLPIRLNIVLLNPHKFNKESFDVYKLWLEANARQLKDNFHHVNILSDRIIMKEMNNCNAGWESITLAPNGKFYVCPAFYYDELWSIGDIESGLSIRNQQLYQLDHAPICQKCDSYHCKRCVWLNYLSTLEVNTPGREQCIVAHIERNASRIINSEIVPEIDYLDPFEIIQL